MVNVAISWPETQEAMLRNEGLKLSPELEVMRQEGLALIRQYELTLPSNDHSEFDDMDEYLNGFEARMLDELDDDN